MTDGWQAVVFVVTDVDTVVICSVVVWTADVEAADVVVIIGSVAVVCSDVADTAVVVVCVVVTGAAVVDEVVTGFSSSSPGR